MAALRVAGGLWLSMAQIMAGWRNLNAASAAAYLSNNAASAAAAAWRNRGLWPSVVFNGCGLS